MAEYLTNDTDLKSVANAIRTKTGGSTNLIYPTGFASAISGIGANCTASASEIMSGKTAYVGNSVITGTMSSKAAATYNVSSSNQTIAASQYLSGAQTIRGVTTANLSAGNIKAGVTVQVGDAASAGRIASVAGTFTSDGTAAAGHILSGKTAYVNGSKVTGNIASKAATTYNASTSDQTIAAGQYLSGAQTIRKVTTANISAANIKKGVTIQVGDSGSATRIANVTGTCPECKIPSSSMVPVMWQAGTSWAGWSYHSESSSYAAQSTAGYRYSSTLDTTSNKAFAVPARMTWTYFMQGSSGSTSTITLEPNTWYYLKGTSSSGSRDLAIYSDSSGQNKLTNFYKLVSWAYA